MNVTVGPWKISSPSGRAGAPARGEVVNAWEPAAFGLYVDRDGDLWEKEPRGWRLRLQDGVAVEPDTLWDWTEGCVRDFAPFIPWG
ncbi:hypothetical protein ACWDUL_12800 [Nocardia niigatensis]